MKKVILSLVLALLTAGSGLYANTMIIYNMRPCNFNFIFNMDNPSVHSQQVFIPTGTTTFTDGSMISTIWSAPTTPAQMALADFSSILFSPLDPNPLYYGFLGNTTTYYDSSPYAPACNGGVYYASWTGGSTVYVLIF